MADVFLSYTEKDRSTARRVVALLESAGWSVWWDRRIPAGDSWPKVLERALATTRCMVVLWSHESVKSEWVYEEASEGRRAGKLVPVLIDAVLPPAGFRGLQAADLSAWDGSSDAPAARDLLRDLDLRLGSGAGKESDSARPSQGTAAALVELEAPKAATTSFSGRQSWLIAAIIATAASATAVALWRPPPQGKPAGEPRTGNFRTDGTGGPAPSAAITEPPPNPSEVPIDARGDKGTSVRAPPRPAATERCSDLLQRLQLGETLSEEERARYQKECGR